MWHSSDLKTPLLIACLMGGAGGGMPTALWAEAPLSAIDWLSQSVATTAPSAKQQPPIPTYGQTGLPGGWPPAPISISPIGAAGRGALGLVPPERSGLPPGLWGQSASGDIARLLLAARADSLPAIQSLLGTILVSELEMPSDQDPQGALFLARVDKLLDMGALDPALALLEQMPSPGPEPFRRWFDIALLLGQEDHACEVMVKNPQIAPTFPARIFCLARQGDWSAASISLRSGRSLGMVDAPTADLLAHFLDPDLYEDDPPLPMPDHPSPLTFRMMEAIGEPISTTALPLAFAQADLRSNNGWKARLEAGERLARSGAISPNRLLGLYTEQKQAASGGVWDRVKAIQSFEAALREPDKAALDATLAAAWGAMKDQRLEVPFAQLFGQRCVAAGLQGAAGGLAFRIGLLSDEFEAVAATHTGADATELFLIGLAVGITPPTIPADPMAQAVAAAFAPDLVPDERFATLLQSQRSGEAVLKAMNMLTDSAAGDLRDVTAGLQLLRQVGLDHAARRVALQLLLLDRRS